jgi:hypothetical protein
MFATGGNEILMQSLLSSVTSTPPHSMMPPLVRSAPAYPPMDLFGAPSLPQLLAASFPMNEPVPKSPLQNILDQIQLQLLFQQPHFLGVLSALTGAKVSEYADRLGLGR